MDLSLYVITASVPELGRDHYDVAAAAIEGGATAIQLRVKRRPMGQTLKIAYAINDLAQKAGVTFIINDHVGIAMAVKAEGLHIGQDDIGISAARRMLGSSVMIGVSTSKHDEALVAEKASADYVGVGAIYETATKPGKPAVGPWRITKVKAVVNIPVIAIGGITEDNLEDCIAAGADGVAVVSAVAMANDMVAATRSLRNKLDAARQKMKQATRA
ncbi:MAG: thiamine phosphate synthase [Thermoleophilia bacterium]